MTDPLTQWLDEMDRDADFYIANNVSVMQVTTGEVKALLECVRAAALASDEIQSQHTMWPGEVDDLADAIARLRALAGREG